MTAHHVRSYVPLVNTDDRPSEPVPQYEICVAGRLAPRWSAWFDGLTVAPDPDGNTVLRGGVADQAALHGVLQKLRDVGLPLLSLTRVPSPASTEPPARPIHEEHCHDTHDA